MIKDLSIIRKELIGFSEVEMPYEFPINCHIKYVTFVNDEESFSIGGKFCRRCNDTLILQNNGPEKIVPICMRDKTGKIIYETRFFIPEDTNDKSIDDKSKVSNDLEDTIQYQQSIIEKLVERIKEAELQKHELTETISSYEELLQEGRFKLKELSVDLRQKTEKLNHYEELIPKLYNSR